MQQRIMWTALPAGRTDDGELQVSVAVSPLLDPQQASGTLEMFPDLLDWPSTEIDWRVTIGTDDPVVATRIGPAPDPALWAALFSPETLVRPPDHPDYTEHLWWSYPVGHIVDLIQQIYQQVATASPTEHPAVAELLDPALGLQPLAHLDPDGTDRREVLVRLLEDQVRQAGALEPGPADPENDVLQLWRFHRPAPLGPRPELPTFDFRQAVALCSEHPGLARRLGLVHDLAVPDDFPTGEVTTVQVEPVWEPEGQDSSDVLPVTACRIGEQAFLPEPADPSEVVRGRLPLGTGPYRIVQIDPDGATLGLMQFARNLVLGTLRGSEDTPTTEPLPTLRSAGFAVARTGHAPAMRAAVATGLSLHAARQADQPILLHAEDVTRGYRFDVWTSVTQRWHSLQDRISDYDFLSSQAQVQISEEGFVVEVPTDRDDAQDPSLYLQESLVRWDGWSLAAPRPGRTLLENDQVADAPSSPAEGFPLQMRFRARPGSLPRLRFGETYRLRARAVDVAGNSVPFDEDDVAASGPVRYLRFEPIAAPVTLLRAPRTEGETVDRLVLRSNFDAAASPATNERHIAPPATTQRTAEEHGRYDTVSGVDPTAYAAIVAREAKTFADEGFGQIDEDQWPESYRLPYFPQVPLPVPYLPDPLARGVALYGLPGAPAAGTFAGFDHASGWPESRPLRLVVEEGAGAPQLVESPGERVLTVQLPKAEVVRVRMSCHLDPDELDLSGIWNWMISKPGVTQAQADGWRTQAGRGLLWMLTPYRTLTLVHAVQQPLASPEFQGLGHGRQPGDTFTDLHGGLSVHRGSTSRVDLHATWTEPVDEGTGGGAPAPVPFDRDHHQVLSVPARESDADLLDFSGLRQEFGDTKHRRITYEAEATSAFSEYFVRHDRVTLSGGEVVVLEGAEDGIVEGSDVVRLGDVRLTRDVDYTIDHEEAQLARVDGGAVPDGAAVDVEYLPAPVSRFSEEPTMLDIPSAARPPSPTCLYVIPTHRWSRGGAGSTIGSVGEGGGLRVYLDRPLLRSGEGELLGVLLDPDPAQPDQQLAPYVTRWGFDPVRGGPPLPQAAPTPAAFPLRVDTGSSLLLDETDASVDVAGHGVAFDEDRGLWYCDLEVDAGDAHWPFIRLALASYQPTSLPGLHLSGVVLADFVQLTPDRSATIVFAASGGSVEVTVLGTGPTTGTEMLAMVERRDEAIEDEALAWGPIPGDRPTVLEGRTERDGATRWSGTVALPSSRGGRATGLRLVIEEFAVQGASSTGDRGGSFRRGRAPAGGSADTTSRQLRYRDIVPLEVRRAP